MQFETQQIKENKSNRFSNLNSKKITETLLVSKVNRSPNNVICKKSYSSSKGNIKNEFRVDLFLDNIYFENRNRIISHNDNNPGLLLVDSWWID